MEHDHLGLLCTAKLVVIHPIPALQVMRLDEENFLFVEFGTFTMFHLAIATGGHNLIIKIGCMCNFWDTVQWDRIAMVLKEMHACYMDNVCVNGSVVIPRMKSENRNDHILFD